MVIFVCGGGGGGGGGGVRRVAQRQPTQARLTTTHPAEDPEVSALNGRNLSPEPSNPNGRARNYGRVGGAPDAGTWSNTAKHFGWLMTKMAEVGRHHGII